MRTNMKIIHRVYVGSWFTFGFCDGFERQFKELKKKQIEQSKNGKIYKHNTILVGEDLLTESVFTGCWAVFHGYTLPILGPFIIVGRLTGLSEDRFRPWYKSW